MADYKKCPFCKNELPAHKGHTKTFVELSDREQTSSVKAMTFNLKRAIQRAPNSEQCLQWTMNYLNRA